MAKSGGLGKGLGALIPSKGAEQVVETKIESGILEISTNLIDPNPYQPRVEFNEEALKSLAESISQFGILQPLIVRKVEDRYQLVAGERRLRAAKISNINKVPVVLKEIQNEQAFEEAIIENVQREDINSLEEAAAYRRLSEEFSLSHEQISKRVGKSRTAITNTLRLLNLPAMVQKYIREGKLTPGHARPILSLPNRFDQEKLAQKIVDNSLSVREVEKLLSPKTAVITKTIKQPKSAGIIEAEEQLEDFLDTEVVINASKGKGQLNIRFSDLDDLERIYRLIISNK